MAFENDWQRAKLATVMLIPLPIAIVLQLVRFGDQVQWSNVALWIFLIDACLIAAICARLWLMPPQPAKA
jgi:hypothetical protein